MHTECHLCNKPKEQTPITRLDSIIHDRQEKLDAILTEIERLRQEAQAVGKELGIFRHIRYGS